MINPLLTPLVEIKGEAEDTDTQLMQRCQSKEP
jgi:hypothetical protein